LPFPWVDGEAGNNGGGERRIDMLPLTLGPQLFHTTQAAMSVRSALRNSIAIKPKASRLGPQLSLWPLERRYEYYCVQHHCIQIEDPRQLSWLIVMELRRLEHFAAVAAEGQFNPGGYAA
jgi:hypothetical protein